MYLSICIYIYSYIIHPKYKDWDILENHEDNELHQWHIEGVSNKTGIKEEHFRVALLKRTIKWGRFPLGLWAWLANRVPSRSNLLPVGVYLCDLLIGGFNHQEKYQPMGRMIPYILENIKCLKPPPRYSKKQNDWELTELTNLHLSGGWGLIVLLCTVHRCKVALTVKPGHIQEMKMKDVQVTFFDILIKITPKCPFHPDLTWCFLGVRGNHNKKPYIRLN